MSRERARRRAERERERDRLAQERERAAVRQARRRERLDRLRALLPRRTWWARQQGRLNERRRRRVGVVLAGFVVVQATTWTLSGDWYLRFGVVLCSLLVFPIVAALIAPRSR